MNHWTEISFKMKECGLVLFTLLVASVHCGNILVIPVDGSHWINMKIIMKVLYDKGHNITVIRPSNSWYIEETSQLYTTVTLKNAGLLDEEFIEKSVREMLEVRRTGSIWARLKLEKEMWDQTVEMIEKDRNLLLPTIKDQTLMQSLKDSRFDVCLTDPALFAGVAICSYLKLPLVFNVRWTVQGEGHFAIAPSPLSYVPVPMMQLSDRMNFLERVLNVVMFLVAKFQVGYYLAPGYNELCNQILGPTTDYFQLIQAADLWLFRVDFVFEFPRPTMPNVVYIGGFHCKPAKPLPQDLEDFVQSSGEHGVIVMSLGTMVDQLPHDVADAIAEAFAELPHKVIWKYKGERPPTLVMDWIPQNDLLGHPKTRVFVAHGGTNGVQEAIYHGVPIIGFGLIWDQPDNLSKMKIKGAAKTVDFATMTKESFLQTLKDVLYEPSYRENMQRLSRLHKDVPIKPLDKAVFWIEYIMRHGGAAHLRTDSYKMPWYIYHSVDVIIFLLGCVAVFVSIIYAVIRKFCRILCVRKKRTKQE